MRQRNSHAAAQQLQRSPDNCCDRCRSPLLQECGPPPSSVLPKQLAALLVQQASWFQPAHFAAAAASMSELGISDALFWNNLAAAAEHQLGGFTFKQLAALLVALARVR